LAELEAVRAVVTVNPITQKYRGVKISYEILMPSM